MKHCNVTPVKFRYLLLLMSLALFDVSASTLEDEFWNWFVENKNDIYAFESSDDAIFTTFTKKLELVNANLGFEFSGVKDNGKRELTISAGGVAANIPAVEKLYDSAPELEKWEILKFKQRKTSLEGFKVGYEGQIVEYKDVKYKILEDGEKLGVVLFFKNFDQDQYDFFAGVGFLFLDLSLGEYDVMTKMGSLEIVGYNSTYFASSKPLQSIVSDFDSYYAVEKPIPKKSSN